MSTTLEPVSQLPASQIPSNRTLRPGAEPRLRLQASKRSKGLNWKLGVLVTLVGVAGAGVVYWFWPRSGQAAEITATVKRATLPITVTERGELESSKTVDVRCEVEGYQNKVVMILDEGKQVTKDQVVVQFDTDLLKKSYEDQEVKFKQAEGKARSAKSELEVAKNKRESDNDKAKTAYELAALDVEKYEKGDFKVLMEKSLGEIALAEKEVQEVKEKVDHTRTFVKKGFGTPEQLRTQEFFLENKQFFLSSKKLELWVLKEFIKRRQETELTAKSNDARRDLERTKATGDAAVDKAQSELDAAVVATRLEKQSFERTKRQLDKCVVKAPQDGILVYSKERYWDPGSQIRQGAMIHYQQTLFSIPDLSQMQIKVKVHESVVKKVKKGMKCEVRVDAYSNATLHGTVETIATLAESAYFQQGGVKEYATMIKIDDLPIDAGLKPGMTSEVKIMVNEIPNALLVPVQAVCQKEQQHYAYVRGPAGATRREITIGETNDKFVEVKSGLEEGEKVVLDARARLAAETKASEAKMEDSPAATPPQAAPVKTTDSATPQAVPVKAADSATPQAVPVKAADSATLQAAPATK